MSTIDWVFVDKVKQKHPGYRFKEYMHLGIVRSMYPCFFCTRRGGADAMQCGLFDPIPEDIPDYNPEVHVPFSITACRDHVACDNWAEVLAFRTAVRT